VFSPIPADPTDMATGYVNDDGDIDLVVASAAIPYVAVLLGDGDGTFTPAPCCETPMSASLPQSVALGDVNGDTVADLVVPTNSGRILIYWGNGDGTFHGPGRYRGPNDPRAVALADVDGDADLDLVVTGFNPDVVAVALNTGGKFGPAISYSTGRLPVDVAVADLDGDGAVDIVTANNNDSVASVLFGLGLGTFGAAMPWPTGGTAESVALADFNGDGLVDLAFANRPLDSNNVGVVATKPGRRPAPPELHDAGTEPAYIVAADFDGDTDPDLAVGNQQSANVSVLRNRR
jgi:hypothetical protein